MSAVADPLTPARFDLLTRRPGRHPITFTPARRRGGDARWGRWWWRRTRERRALCALVPWSLRRERLRRQRRPGAAPPARRRPSSTPERSTAERSRAAARRSARAGALPAGAVQLPHRERAHRLRGARGSRRGRRRPLRARLAPVDHPARVLGDRREEVAAPPSPARPSATASAPPDRSTAGRTGSGRSRRSSCTSRASATAAASSCSPPRRSASSGRGAGRAARRAARAAPRRRTGRPASSCGRQLRGQLARHPAHLGAAAARVHLDRVGVVRVVRVAAQLERTAGRDRVGGQRLGVVGSRPRPRPPRAGPRAAQLRARRGPGSAPSRASTSW